jgi:late competence protein required for DNA uptake (superfamily II DNA/RNA helicase)
MLLYFQPGEERTKLDESIRDFRLGKINVIVSTSVLEEGKTDKKIDFRKKSYFG